MTRSSPSTVSRWHLLACLVLLCSPSYIIHAFPTGAGSCYVDEPSVGGSHLSAGDTQMEAVSLDQGFLVSVDDQLLTAGVPLVVTHNARDGNTLSVFRPTEAIKGFNFVIWYNDTLIVDGSETKLDNMVTFGVQEDLSKDNNLCENNVVGLTHVNNNDKFEITTPLLVGEEILFVPAGFNAVALDITLVGQNSEGISRYYYSQFLLQFVPDLAEDDDDDATSAPTDEEETGGPTAVVEGLQTNPEVFSTLLMALELANLTQPLQTLSSMTLLAPTNDAFVDSVEGTLWVKFTTDPAYQHHLLDLLLYHVVPDRVLAMTDRALAVPTWQYNGLGGEPLDFVRGVINDGGARIILLEEESGEENALAVNMTEDVIIYGIDRVLGRSQLIASALSLLQAFNEANEDKPYSILFSLLEAADPEITDTLSDWERTVTFFAANNAAWEAAFSPEELEALVQPEQAEELNLLLSRHVILDRNLLQEDWINDGSVTMTSGEELPVTAASSLSGDEGAVPSVSSTIAGVTVSSVNRFVTNGIIHAIDGIFLRSNNTNTTDVSVSGGNNSSALGDSINGTNANIPDTQVCELCNAGTFRDNFIFPGGGASCSLLGDGTTGEGLVDSDEECFYNRALAAGYCGCSFPAGVCNVCEGTFTRELGRDALIGVEVGAVIPGEISLTCGDLFTLPAIDLDDTCGVLYTKYARYCGCPGALAETVGVILEETESLSFFDAALKELNIDKVLSNSTRNFTIFAPNDRAVQSDELLQSYTRNLISWSKHTSEILQNHIVGDSLLSSGELFSGAIESLTSLAGGFLSIDKRGQTIGNQTIVISDLEAFDGYVHAIDGILHLPWRGFSIIEFLQNGLQTEEGARRLQQTADSFSILLGLFGQTGLVNDEALVNFTENGTTLVAPTDGAFMRVEEGDAAEADRYDGVLYHILESNLYGDDVPRNGMVVMPTRHSVADVLVTRGEDGTLRYNNAVVNQEAFASNGLVHMAEEVLQPPTVVSFLEFMNEFTGTELGILQTLLLAAGWGGESLASHINETESERITLLAPTDNLMNLSGISGDFLDRLVTPTWSRHLQSLLKNLILDVPLTKGNVSSSGLTADTVGGTLASLQESSIAQSLSGTDGIVHVMSESFELPLLFAEDAFSYITNSIENATRLAELIALTGLDSEGRAELTVLVPPDASWGTVNTEQGENEVIDILENHIFEGIFFYEDFQALDGTVLSSVNGEKWIISNLDGTVFLNSENAGESVTILPPSGVLVRDGVIHFVDSVLENGSTSSPTASPVSEETDPSQPDTISPGSFQNCSACDGPIDVNATLPDGSSCGAWQWDVSQLPKESEECRLERAVAVQSCGCIAPANATQCELCTDGEMTPSVQIPDARGLTCGSLGSLVSVDGPATCEILNTKYASFCGCQDAVETTCSFCESGEPLEKSFILPNETQISLNFRVFGNLVNTSCQGFADFFSVQTPNSCSEATRQLVDESSFEMRPWCGCPGATPENRCGEFCTKGSILQESLVVDKELGLTCKYYSDIFDYIADDNICEETTNLRTACCAPPIVTVNASFVAFNEQALTASALTQSGETLNTAFEDFVKALVVKTESQEEAASATRRNLLASFQPQSSEIFAVQSVGCPVNAGVPVGSTCHNVFGRFNLIVEDEEPEVVLERYSGAVETGIEDGTLQESIDAVDPDYPFRVAGVAVTADDPVQGAPQNKNATNEKLSWWIILFIVLACLFGLCGFGFLLAYGKTRRQVKQIPDEEEHQAPMAEVSVLMKAPDEDQPRDEENGERGEHSFSDSQFWEMNESNPLADEDDLLETALSKEAPGLEQAPVSIEDDGSDDEMWEDEAPESSLVANTTWDEDDDDDEAWENSSHGSDEKVEETSGKATGNDSPPEISAGDDNTNQGSGADEEWDDEQQDRQDAPASGEEAPIDALVVTEDTLEAEDILDSLRVADRESNTAMESFDEGDDAIDEPGTIQERQSKIDEPIRLEELQAELASVDGRAFENDMSAGQQSYSEIVDSENAWKDLQAAVATASPAEEVNATSSEGTGNAVHSGKGTNEADSGAFDEDDNTGGDWVEGESPSAPINVPASPTPLPTFQGLNGSFNASFHDM